MTDEYPKAKFYDQHELLRIHLGMMEDGLYVKNGRLWLAYKGEWVDMGNIPTPRDKCLEEETKDD